MGFFSSFGTMFSSSESWFERKVLLAESSSLMVPIGSMGDAGGDSEAAVPE